MEGNWDSISLHIVLVILGTRMTNWDRLNELTFSANDIVHYSGMPFFPCDETRGNNATTCKENNVSTDVWQKTKALLQLMRATYLTFVHWNEINRTWVPTNMNSVHWSTTAWQPQLFILSHHNLNKLFRSPWHVDVLIFNWSHFSVPVEKEKSMAFCRNESIALAILEWDILCKHVKSSQQQ
jgi:hypothetical protein